MKVFVDTAPAPPDLATERGINVAKRPRGTWTLTLAAGVVVAVVALAGLVAVRGDGAANTEDMSWGDWFEEAALNATEVYTFSPIWQAQLGPAPEFDTADFGREVVLEPLTSSEPEWPWRSLFYDDLSDETEREFEQVLVGGWVGQALISTVRAEISVDDPADSTPDPATSICPFFGHSGSQDRVDASYKCADAAQRTEFGRPSVTRLGPLTDVTQNAWWFLVPNNAALIAIDHAGEKFWQRPRGGMGLFVGDFYSGSLTYTVYGADSTVLLEGSNQY
jgi:hypothetical protein